MKCLMGVIACIGIVCLAWLIYSTPQAIEMQDQTIMRTSHIEPISLDVRGPDQSLFALCGRRPFGNFRARLRNGPIRSAIRARRHARWHSRGVGPGGACVGGSCVT